MHINWFW